MTANITVGKKAEKQPLKASLCERTSIGGRLRARTGEDTGRSSALCALVLILALTSYAGPPVQRNESKTEMAAAKFPQFVSEYLQDLHSRHPMLAAASGIHTWDAQLEDYSSQALSAESNAIKAFQARLEKIPPLELRLSDIFDYQILASNMSGRLLELERIQSYERNPQVYNDPISTGLLQLAMFESSSADSRLRCVIAKENLVPRLLDSARLNIRKTPAVFLKVAIDGFKGTLSFVQTDLPKAFASVDDPTLQSEFKKSTRTAARSNREVHQASSGNETRP